MHGKCGRSCPASQPEPATAVEPEPTPEPTTDAAPPEDTEARRADLLAFLRKKVAAAADSNAALAELGKICEELKTTRNVKDMDPAMFDAVRAAADARI